MNHSRKHAPSGRIMAGGIGLTRRVAAALCVTLAVGPMDAAANEPEKPMVEFRRLLAFDLEFERGFRDRSGRRAREVEIQPLLRFAATIAPDRTWSGFLEADFLSQVTWERGDPREITSIARINQAYLRYDDEIELRFGRWLFRDEREWLIDENFDGLLMSFELGDVSVDALAGRVGWLPRELFNQDSRGDRINHYAILAEIEPARDVHHAGFIVVSDDRERPEDYQISFGLRSYGEIGSGFNYWANAGLSGGKAEGRRLQGYGFDIGGTYRFDDHPLRPRLTLGYAWGSGDRDPASGTDRAYRQTGLQSNETRLGGFAKFKYYGEALDPDLSNIAIATAGVAITANERISFDVFYHHYRQVEMAGGGGRHVGDGLDLVVGFRPEGNLEIDAAVGWFKQGSSAAAPESGVVARIEFEYAF
jgi:alginate production protein